MAPQEKGGNRAWIAHGSPRDGSSDICGDFWPIFVNNGLGLTLWQICVNDCLRQQRTPDLLAHQLDDGSLRSSIRSRPKVTRSPLVRFAGFSSANAFEL
ncbi:hypothetical protein [Sphingopyxis terrae]|uniref:hypothetical protein n=1 Tax=Sphingopyxis terrae TaxID=33052 RepID=UPI0007868C70|nr:hypothetical protein [Sphingopyxis terrae]